jgi:prepilin-type N-terminal cleavage/methylation domain-containing protein
MKNTKGFTLIEVLVSIFLLSMMAFSIIKITDQSTTTKIETIKEDNDFLRIYSALYTIQWDINHFYSPLFQQPRLQINKLAPNINSTEEERQSFSEFERNIVAQFRTNKRFSGYSDNGDLIPRLLKESNNTMTFLSNGYRRKNLNEKKSQLAWITYTLEDPTNDDIEALKEKEQKEDVKPGKNLVRYIDAANPFSPDPSSKDDLFPQVVMEKVINMEWSFWDRKKKAFSLIENYTEEHQPITSFKVKIEYLDLYDQEQQVEKIFPTNFSERAIANKLNLEQKLSSQQNNQPPDPSATSTSTTNPGGEE